MGRGGGRKGRCGLGWGKYMGGGVYGRCGMDEWVRRMGEGEGYGTWAKEGGGVRWMNEECLGRERIRRM